MPFEYFDHTADIGILSMGTTLEEALEEGGRAMFNLMVDPHSVGKKKVVLIECEADDIPELFVQMLNELLTQRDINDMFFRDFRVECLESVGKKYILKGKAYGEIVDPSKHEVKAEVKAATYAGLEFKEEDGSFKLRCVVDI